MSSFKTPSRASASSAAATLRGDGSSSRRVVRSALEALMDTATPELPSRAGPTTAAAPAADLRRSAEKNPPASATTVGGGHAMSPFSVTYTTAPGRVAAAALAPSTAALSASDHRGSNAAASSVLARSSAALPATRMEEPSALAFLSPQGKKKMGDSSGLPDEMERVVPHSRRTTAQSSSGGVNRMVRRVSLDRDDSDDSNGDSSVFQVKHAQHSSQDVRVTAARPPRHMTEPAAVSPSRSLYSDVEAARHPPPPPPPQQQQRHRSSSRSTGDASRSSSPFSPVALSDMSFVMDNDDDHSTDDDEEDEEGESGGRSDAEAPLGEEEEESAAAAVHHHPLRNSHSRSRRAQRDDEPRGMIPAAQVDARIAAALRQYEKERDAEEESVLQQVSAEVEEQASRYAALAEAYDQTSARLAAAEAALRAAEEARETSEAALLQSRQLQVQQRETLKRLEVELYHARDAQETQQQQQHHSTEEAEAWESARRRYEKRHATLEAQLSQLRDELREKDATVASLRESAKHHDEELHALRQRAAQQDSAAHDDLADISARMLRLGQNMASMESVVQERDDTIAQLRAQLSSAEAERRSHHTAVATLEMAKERVEAELAASREALQRQTDEVRRRMQRLTQLEQQKEALRGEAQAARQALADGVREQTRVTECLEALRREWQAWESAAASRAASQSSGRSHSPPAGRNPVTAAAHLDDTLVYEEGDSFGEEESEEAGGFDSDVSAVNTDAEDGEEKLSDDDDEEIEDEDREKKGVSRSRRGGSRGVEHTHLDEKRSKKSRHESPEGRHSPPRARPLNSQRRSLSSSSATAAAGAKNAASSSSSSPSLPRLTRLMHHSAAQAELLVRELRRRLETATRRYRSVSPPSTTRAALQGPKDAPQRRPQGDQSSIVMVAKLEQACRYLRSELSTAKATLAEAQAENQWRALSMAKWEEDLQRTRRELLQLEKERLAWMSEREALEIVKQEMGDQVTELQQAHKALTDKYERLVPALEEAKAAQEQAHSQLTTAKDATEAAEAAMQREKASAARLAEKLAEATDAQAAVAEELSALQAKYKTVMAQLQTLRSQEAAQQVKEEQESRAHAAEVAELRAAVAQLRVAEGAWESERSRLQHSLSTLRTTADALSAAVDEGQQHCAALASEEAARQAAELAALTRMARLVEAPAALCAALSTAAATERGAAQTSARVSPTEKKLFDAEEPSVEEVVVEEADSSAVAEMIRSRMRPRQQQRGAASASALSRIRLLNTPRRHPPASSAALNRSHSKQRAAPLVGGPTTDIAALRQAVVTAVEKMAQELAQLRSAIDSGPARTTEQQQQQQQRKKENRRAEEVVEAADRGAAQAWFGAETAASPSRHASGRAASSSPWHINTPSVVEVPLMGTHRTSAPHPSFASPPSAAHSQSPSAASRLRASPSPATTPDSHIRDDGHFSRLDTHAAEEHRYNISPWTPPSRVGQRGAAPSLPSPSARPPASSAKAAEWSEVRRSSSCAEDDGLSVVSRSGTRGEVDGSASPARPPSLRTHTRTV